MDITSMQGGRGMISAIEILPGMRGRIRPLRIVARDVPYYSRLVEFGPVLQGRTTCDQRAQFVPVNNYAAIGAIEVLPQ